MKKKAPGSGAFFFRDSLQAVYSLASATGTAEARVAARER